MDYIMIFPLNLLREILPLEVNGYQGKEKIVDFFFQVWLSKDLVPKSDTFEFWQIKRKFIQKAPPLSINLSIFMGVR